MIAERLRYNLENLGKATKTTNAQLARACGFKQSSLSKFMNRKQASISFETVDAIARHYSIDPSRLFQTDWIPEQLDGNFITIVQVSEQLNQQQRAIVAATALAVRDSGARLLTDESGNS